MKARFSLRFLFVVISIIAVAVMIVSWIVSNRLIAQTVYYVETPNGKIVKIVKKPAFEELVSDNYEISIGAENEVPFSIATFAYVAEWGGKLQFISSVQGRLVVLSVTNERYINVAIDCDTNEIAVKHLDLQKFEQLIQQENLQNERKTRAIND